MVASVDKWNDRKNEGRGEKKKERIKKEWLKKL